MKRWMAFLVVIGWCAAISPARGDGFIVIEPPPHWHPLRHPAPYAFAPLEISYHHVLVKIKGQIATTTVDQEFYNPNPQRLEGTYLFPVPKGAHIDKFSMDIGGKQVEAELLPADKARGIYEDIVRRLRDPALLEYAGRDVFKVRVFPIEPNSTKRIQLSYSEILTADSGLVGYRYPLNTEKFSAKPIRNVSVKVELESQRPLKTLYSPSASVEIKRDGPYRATLGYEASDALPSEDFEFYFGSERDDVGVNLVTCKSGDEDGFFLMLAAPGVDAKADRVLPKDIAFVLDTSGSMAGRKLDQAKKALRFCIENLNANDRFEIIRFSTDVEPLFDKFTAASRENRDRAGEFVDGLKAIGGTAIDDALQKALSLHTESGGRPFVLVFLTDGQPTIGVTDEDQIVGHVKENNRARARVFSFGIGADVNTHLLDKIADETRAFAQYVLPEEDLEVKVSSFFSKISNPVLANPTLKFSGGVRVTQMYPSPLPDLFKGEQCVVVGRYSGNHAAAVSLEGTVNGEIKRFTQDVNFGAETSQSEFIPRLWATRRVGYLLDEIRIHGENAELRDEVTSLARQYGIVTPYTAYLIVEDETRRRLPVETQSLPDLGANTRARSQAEHNWNSFKEDRAGNSALAWARGDMDLKSADAPTAAIDRSSAETIRGLGFAAGAPADSAASAEPPAPNLGSYTGQTKFVQGKNFFQNKDQWLDAALQRLPGAQRVRVQFNSPEYFELIRKEPKALPFLALGRNVQFVLGNKVYEIYDTN